MPSPTAYELYRSGVDLLEQGDNHAAALPLSRARDLEPTTAMVREALGRALFASQRYREAAEEFTVLVELEPLNDYGQFCLGRALQLQGLHAQARPPLTLAALLQPARRDYAVYRDRTIAALAGDAPTAGTGEGSARQRAAGEAAAGRDAAGGEGDPEDVAGADRPRGGGAHGGDAPTAPAEGAPPPRRSGAGPWGAPAVDPATADESRPAQVDDAAEPGGSNGRGETDGSDEAADTDRPGPGGAAA